MKNALFNFPYFKFSYSECSIILVGKHIFRAISCYPITIVICLWGTVSITIKWCNCIQLIVSEIRSSATSTLNLLSCSLVRETPEVRKVKQKCKFIFNIIPIRSPLGLGVASNTVPIFYLKEGYGTTFSVTARVKIIEIPTMDRSTVK